MSKIEKPRYIYRECFRNESADDIGVYEVEFDKDITCEHPSSTPSRVIYKSENYQELPGDINDINKDKTLLTNLHKKLKSNVWCLAPATRTYTCRHIKLADGKQIDRILYLSEGKYYRCIYDTSCGRILCIIEYAPETEEERNDRICKKLEERCAIYEATLDILSDKATLYTNAIEKTLEDLFVFRMDGRLRDGINDELADLRGTL